MEMKLFQVCRACMISLDNLLQYDEFTKMTDELIDMFTTCTSIKIAEDDGLSSNICIKCIDSIHSCYNFIKVCKTTDANLCEYLREHKRLVKQEASSPVKEEGFLNDPSSEYLEDDPKNDHLDDDSYNENFEVKIEPDFSNNDDSASLVSLVASNLKSSQRLNQLKSGKSKLKVKHKDKSKSGKVKLKNKKLKSKKSSKQEDLKPLRPYKELKKEYTCPVCDHVILGKSALNQHLTEQHEEYRKYVCQHCNKGFARSHYLTQHLIIHTDKRPFACDLCTKTYKQRGQLITHRRLHTQERPYSCDKCGMSFNMKCALVNHSRLHHGDEPNLCHLCGASFAQVGNLMVHMRVHTGEKPYSCSMCTFRCSVQSGMRRHERTHTNLRAQVCTVCQKGFNNSSSLARHLRIHTGELPYKCDYCSKAFIDNWKRKNHLVKAHNISLDTIPRMIPGRKRTYINKEKETGSNAVVQVNGS